MSEYVEWKVHFISYWSAWKLFGAIDTCQKKHKINSEEWEKKYTNSRKTETETVEINHN